MQSISNSTRTFMKPQPKKEGPKSPRRKLSIKMPTKLTLPWLLVLLLVAFSIFMFTQYREARDKLQKPTTPAAASRQVDDVVKRVSKLIILPKKETPTIITVKDASKLRAEKFYANAQDGDITLVYSKAEKAILYRPSANIIVNAAPVTTSPTKT